MATLSALMDDTFRRLRAGDEAGAIARLQAAVREGTADLPARGFLGMLLCRAGRAADGVEELEAVLAIAPNDVTARVNLATALVSLQRLDRAAEVIAAAVLPDIRLRRLHALICQERGRLEQARDAYRDVVAVVPGDFESWNNLGNVLRSIGALDDAIAALRRALSIEAALPGLHLNLAQALTDAGRNAERLTAMRDAARRFPDDAAILLELGLSEAANERFDAAEAMLRRSIALDPTSPAAYVELTILYDNLNRLDALDALVDEAVASGVRPAETGFIRGWSLRRRGRFAEALAQADALPETISAMRRHQLAGELADRLDLPERAYAEFEGMNREAALLHPAPVDELDFIAEVRASAGRLSQLDGRSWRPVRPSGPPAPIFIGGFPRSGTTLLDTLLMNISALHVLEERPVIDPARTALGDPARLPALGLAETERLRARYFATLDRIAPPSSRDMTVVDKHPFHIVRMDVIHRLFPDARIVLVERHPCDAVLSCFMQNFQMNRAMRSFGTLRGAAELYDAALHCREEASERLPLNIHHIRYERMIADLEGEMRALVDFLGFPWDPRILDNEGAAARRDRIATASYAQVGQPIYARAIGRWERYRKQMAPVLPILAPWAERMGYSI